MRPLTFSFRIRLIGPDGNTVAEAELDEPTPPRHIEWQGRIYNAHVTMPDLARGGEPIVLYVDGPSPVYALSSTQLAAGSRE